MMSNCFHRIREYNHKSKNQNNCMLLHTTGVSHLSLSLSLYIYIYIYIYDYFLQKRIIMYSHNLRPN